MSTQAEKAYLVPKSELEMLLYEHYLLAGICNSGVEIWDTYGEDINDFIKDCREVKSDFETLEDMVKYEMTQYTAGYTFMGEEEHDA